MIVYDVHTVISANGIAGLPDYASLDVFADQQPYVSADPASLFPGIHKFFWCGPVAE
jgi:hypothetical protein